MALLLFTAIIPTVLILIFILKFDKYQKEPPLLLAILFILGILSIIPTIIAELILNSLLNVYLGKVSESLYILTEAFIGIALIEEFFKLTSTRLFSFKHKAYNEVYDGMIYCVMVSLGFATAENILYVMQYGLSTAIVRAVTAVPAHTMFALVMGYYMSLNKFLKSNKSRYRILTLLFPVLLHGIYDAMLMLGIDSALLLFIPFMVFMYTKSIKLIKETSEIPPVNQEVFTKPKAVVVAALIWQDGKFMICQRPPHKQRGLLWEFVGGKTEEGETLEDALIRECEEELAVNLEVKDIFMQVHHDYPDIDIDLILFNASIKEGTPQLIEHVDIRFISPYEIDNFEFCPADVEILAKIKEIYC